MHPSKTMAFQMRRDKFQMGACTVWILLYFLPQLCVGVPAQKGTFKIMDIKQRDIILNTLLNEQGMTIKFFKNTLRHKSCYKSMDQDALFPTTSKPSLEEML